MEKPDEPSGESKEESLSNYTCADPQLGKKPVGKSASFSLLPVYPRRRVLGLIFLLVSVLIITVVTCVVYFIYLFIYFFLSFSFDSLARHIW